MEQTKDTITSIRISAFNKSTKWINADKLPLWLYSFIMKRRKFVSVQVRVTFKHEH